MARLVGIVVLVLTTGLLAGCGGGDDTLTKDEYQAKVTGAAKELATSFEEIGKEAQGMAGDVSSVDDLKELLGNLSTVVTKAEDNLRTAADELDALSPPDDAKEANEKLVAGLDEMADDFADLATALDNGSVATIASAATRLRNITSSEAGKKIQEAVGILEQAGYRFGDLG